MQRAYREADQLLPKPEGTPPEPDLLQTGALSRFFSGKEVENTYQEAQNPKSRSTIVQMNPKDFLSVVETGRDATKAARAVEILKREGSFNTLPRILIDENGKILSHDGRHRMEALQARGVTSVPVEVRSQTLRWGEST